MCIYGFVLLQCRFRSDYSGCTRTVCLIRSLRGFGKVTKTRPGFVPQGRVLVAAGSQSDFRPSSSCGLVEGADILPVKGAGEGLRPWCTGKQANLEILESPGGVFATVPAVFGAALGVLPAAGAQRLHAVPAPQQRALGPRQQAVPVVGERQRSHLRREPGRRVSGVAREGA